MLVVGPTTSSGASPCSAAASRAASLDNDAANDSGPIVSTPANAPSPYVWSQWWCVTTTWRRATSVTVAIESRSAWPWAGLDPLSTSNAPLVPTTSPTFTVAGSSVVTYTPSRTGRQTIGDSWSVEFMGDNLPRTQAHPFRYRTAAASGLDLALSGSECQA